MEQFEFIYPATIETKSLSSHALVGVVSSGNLEVLLEAAELEGNMMIIVKTAATGFKPIWEAVLKDFSERHPLSNVKITLHDTGATPAVVSLRLDQVVEEFEKTRL